MRRGSKAELVVRRDHLRMIDLLFSSYFSIYFSWTVLIRRTSTVCPFWISLGSLLPIPLSMPALFSLDLNDKIRTLSRLGRLKTPNLIPHTRVNTILHSVALSGPVAHAHFPFEDNTCRQGSSSQPNRQFIS